MCEEYNNISELQIVLPEIFIGNCEHTPPAFYQPVCFLILDSGGDTLLNAVLSDSIGIQTYILQT